jgi:aminoglycoside phosphotransferase (APT) family kinase protein
MQRTLARVAARFQIDADFVRAEPYGSGHINDTYAVYFIQGGCPVRCIIQRINHTIFKDVPALMDNIGRTIRHVRQTLHAQHAAEIGRRTLTLIPTVDNRDYLLDENGLYWRAYRFIENARSYDVIANTQQAFAAAQAFGRFQACLADIPPPRLHDTIPNFHNTRARFRALTAAVDADARNRAAQAQEAIRFALQRESMADMLLDLQAEGALPERVTHNDTKLNNVLIEDATGEGICVIDLDTVMPGLAPYDFGDMVRTATNTGTEDERDLSKVTSDLALFETLVRGYLDSAGAMLVPKEN